jgi:hypothetical protein
MGGRPVGFYLFVDHHLVFASRQPAQPKANFSKSLMLLIILGKAK